MKLIAQASGDLGSFTAPTEAFAPTGAADSTAFAGPITSFISNVIGFLTVLGGIIFLLMFIVAALNWISSGGEKGKVETAKNQMTQGAIGLTIVIASYAIAGVVGRVLGINILDPISVISTLAPGGN